MGTPLYSISVIIPMYNEEENAKRIIDYAAEVLSIVASDWEILVVESGSTDGTRKIVEEKARKNPKIIPLFQEKREGMGSALRLGYSRATKDLIWHLESDSPFDLNDMKKAIVYFNTHDGVIGYRTAGRAQSLNDWAYSEDNQIWDFIRLYYHVGYNLLIRLMFGLKVRDVNFSYKIFKREAIKKLKLQSKGWFIDAEIVLEMKKKNFKCKEIAIEYKKRLYGNSTVRFFTPFKMLLEMLDYRFRRWKV